MPNDRGVAMSPSSSPAVYGGYFGAGAGIIMLAVFSPRTVEPLAVTNVVESVATGSTNAVASAPVAWSCAGALALGTLVGGWCGYYPRTPCGSRSGYVVSGWHPRC